MFESEVSSPSVAVALCGGLGNQLFQYATGRALALRTGAPLVLDLEWFERIKRQNDGHTTIRPYALTPFALDVETQCISLQPPQTPGLLKRILRRFLRQVLRQQENSNVYAERGFAFDPTVLSLKAPMRLDGYWQSYRYFEDCAEILREELGSPREVSEATRDMLKEIAQCDAICLHVRRGDYITNQAAAQFHGVCSLDYYQRGVRIATEGVADPRFFVFSDDPEWVRENLDIGLPFTVVDVNGPDDAHQDLWLMAACQRFVIANSSLSWWGAWLGSHPDKKVVYPRRWFLDESIDVSNLCPKDWIPI